MNHNLDELKSIGHSKKLYNILVEWQDDLINMNLRQKDVNTVLRKIR